MPAPVIQFKRGSSSGITSFKAGEPAFTTDTFDFYIGLDNQLANNKFLGSHRYWSKETASKGSGVNLVESTSGTDFITLAAPASVGAAVTYYFPATQGTTGTVLSNDGIGNLSWVSTSTNNSFSGITTFTDTTESTTYQDGAVIISGGLGVAKNVNVHGNLKVDGNVTIGGSFVSLRGQDVYIENKDIILGFTTSITPNDDTANHAGVAIASTVGSPLAAFAATGINTLPNTYKQLMWFKSGTLGFSTDAFAFNYGLAIGTTTMGNGVRLAVGSGITMSDDSISATNGYFTTISASNITGSLTGTISTATRATTVDTTGTTSDADYYVTFVDNVTTDFAATLRVGAGLSVNPSTGNVKVSNSLSVTNGATITGIATVGTFKLSGTSGIGITGISSSATLTENSNSYLPTQAAVKAYVDAVDVTLGLNADTGGPSTVSTSQTLTINGTANEVETSVSGQTVTVGLPNTVIVGTALSTPTVRASSVKASDDTTAFTIANGTGAVGFANSVTISGDLYVLGTATEVNTQTLKVEDSLVEIGLVNDNGVLVPPTSDLNIDIGVLFNWYSGSAKKASVFWDDSAQRIAIASDVTESTGVLTANSWAGVEIGSLWVNDCAGQSQVISCTGSQRFLENITVDAGTF